MPTKDADNGILGNFNANQRQNIDIQLMRVFLTTMTLLCRCFDVNQGTHSSIVFHLAFDVSSLRNSQQKSVEPILRWQYSPVNNINDWSVSDIIFGVCLGGRRVQKQVHPDGLDILGHLHSSV